MNDVIDLSNIESGVMNMAGSDVLLDPLMEEIEQIYRPKAESRNLVLAWDGEQLGGHIYTDRGRLIQILEHLLCNAIKFTLKGTVRLGYRKKEEGRIWFYVTDTGCGIPPEKQHLILTTLCRGWDSDCPFVKSLSTDCTEQLGWTQRSEKDRLSGLLSPICPVNLFKIYG